MSRCVAAWFDFLVSEHVCRRRGRFLSGRFEIFLDALDAVMLVAGRRLQFTTDQLYGNEPAVIACADAIRGTLPPTWWAVASSTMATQRDRILDALKSSGEPLDDDELARRTGIRPRQAVNQVCRALERAGTLRRLSGEHGKIVNILTTTGLERPPSPLGGEGGAVTADQAESAEALADVDPVRSLFILTCSAAKTPGGDRESPSLDEWPEALYRARATLQARLRVDTSCVLPAWRRYRGHFYDSAGPALADAVAAGAHILIISGGYGVLRAEEKIGYYDNVFRTTDWPRGLLEQIMTNEVRRVEAQAVVAFASVTSGYGKLIRRTRWRDAGVEAALHVTCQIKGGGAMVRVPQALGQAFAAFWRHDLAAWPPGAVVESLT